MVDLTTRVLLAITKRIPMPHKVKWKIGMRDEVAFWEKHMVENHLPSSGRVVDMNPPLQPHFIDLVKHCTGDVVRILDVGSGPFTRVGTVMPGKRVELVAVDPLADAYKALFKKHGITPRVVPHRGEGERLTSMFAMDSFDMIHANNSLDHSYDPVKVISEMFTVLKPGGSIFLRHEVNVAEGASYVGLHQWNFHPRGREFWISDRNRGVDVNIDRLLKGRADLELQVEGSMMINIIRKR